MKDQDKVGITFVNTLIGRGILNGVANLSFAAFNFTPTDEGKIEPDPVVVCRLRMDKVCLYQMQKALNELVEQIEQAEGHAEVAPIEESVKGVSAKRVSPESTH